MFLTKSRSGNYHIIYDKPNGKRGTKTTKEKLKIRAMKKLREFQDRLEDERTREVIPIGLKEFSFNFMRNSEPYYTDKTMSVYKSTFKLALNHFGNVQLSELTTQQIENYLHLRIKETSIFAARKDLANFSCSFNRAVRDGYLKENPCKGIRRFKLPEQQPSFYTKEEFDRLIEALDSEDLRDLVKVAVNTGCRQMELISLQWHQVNFEQEIINLDNRTHITKTKRIRTLPFNNQVKSILQKRYQNKNPECEFVFTLNGQPFNQDKLSRDFKKYVYKARVNPDLNFHSLRHTFASWLVQKGVSIYVVSKLLGHSNISTTEIYSHLRRDDLKNATEILDKEFK
jgi:integrase